MLLMFQVTNKLTQMFSEVATLWDCLWFVFMLSALYPGQIYMSGGLLYLSKKFNLNQSYFAATVCWLLYSTEFKHTQAALNLFSDQATSPSACAKRTSVYYHTTHLGVLSYKSFFERRTWEDSGGNK
eukprot:GHVR01054360.1.p1 GENE.GHVR01054360.1~~GHVR01054360.1.p1  ORF type:complete len:127 (-),score=14.20 GHVR01054360.1:194-574(-)